MRKSGSGTWQGGATEARAVPAEELVSALIVIVQPLLLISRKEAALTSSIQPAKSIARALILSRLQTLIKVGTPMAETIPIMATITISSTSVKPFAKD
jgi:type IV secretory pathway TrbL component